MPAFGDRPKPYAHFLNNVSRWAEEYHEPYETVAVAGTSNSISSNTASIIIGNHHDNAWSRNYQEQSEGFS